MRGEMGGQAQRRSGGSDEGTGPVRGNDDLGLRPWDRRSAVAKLKIPVECTGAPGAAPGPSLPCKVQPWKLDYAPYPLARPPASWARTRDARPLCARRLPLRVPAADRRAQTPESANGDGVRSSRACVRHTSAAAGTSELYSTATRGRVQYGDDLFPSAGFPLRGRFEPVFVVGSRASGRSGQQDLCAPPRRCVQLGRHPSSTRWNHAS